MAWLNLRRSLDRELRYRSDQPRAPRGTSEGGHWIDDAGRARGRDVALAGRLIDQRTGVGDGKFIRMCTYQDFFGRQYSIELDAAEYCPPTLRARPYYGPL